MHLTKRAAQNARLNLRFKTRAAKSALEKRASRDLSFKVKRPKSAPAPPAPQTRANPSAIARTQLTKNPKKRAAATALAQFRR
jgi:hypothetical protein